MFLFGPYGEPLRDGEAIRNKIISTPFDYGVVPEKMIDGSPARYFSRYELKEIGEGLDKRNIAFVESQILVADTLFGPCGEPLRDGEAIRNKIISTPFDYGVVPEKMIDGSPARYFSRYELKEIGEGLDKRNIAFVESQILVADTIPERFRPIMAIHERGHHYGLSHQEMFSLEMGMADKMAQITGDTALKEDYLRWMSNSKNFDRIKSNCGNEKQMNIDQMMDYIKLKKETGVDDVYATEKVIDGRIGKWKNKKKIAVVEGFVLVADTVPKRFVPIVAIHERGHHYGLSHQEMFTLETGTADKISEITGDMSLKEDYLRWLNNRYSDEKIFEGMIKANLGTEKKKNIAVMTNYMALKKETGVDGVYTIENNKLVELF
jgi:hypothetical protein